MHLVLAILLALVLASALAWYVMRPAWAVNNVAVTDKNDWTVGTEFHPVHGQFEKYVNHVLVEPPCGNPLPCVGDLDGTNNADFVAASGGWDWINAGGGQDELNGGGGMDVFYGGDGADTIRGQDGHDHLYGDGGNDLVYAQDGADEHMHIEETWGTRVQEAENDPNDNDTCKLDADAEGAVVNECETLIIIATTTPAYNGGTALAKNKNELANWNDDDDPNTPGVDESLDHIPTGAPASAICGPGSYSYVNDDTHAQSPAC